MAFRRACALMVSAFILLSAVAFTAPCKASPHNASASEDSLPISLASPGQSRMYFLPAKNEAVSADPLKKGFILPSITIDAAVQSVSFFREDFTASGHPEKSCIVKCITPRAP